MDTTPAPDRSPEDAAPAPDDATGSPLIEPQVGPGLRPSPHPDPIAVTSLAFAALCLIPNRYVGIGGVHAFGPIEFTAILAIVAVVFGVVAVLRGVDTGSRTVITAGAAGAGIGILRLFLYPFLGW